MPWPPGGLVRPERERVLMHQYMADLLHRARPARNDFRKLAAALATEPSTLPLSVTVRMSCTNYAYYLDERAEHTLAEWARLASGGP